MQNQVSAEAQYSATYVENYLDSVENLPDDVQRNLSRIRDIDTQIQTLLREVENNYEQFSAVDSEPTAPRRNRLVRNLNAALISTQELGDEKLQIVNQLQELIDHKTRQLDSDFRNLNYGKEDQTIEVTPSSKVQQRPITPVVQALAASSLKAESLPAAAVLTTIVHQVTQGSCSAVAHNLSERMISAMATSGGSSNERTTTKRARRPRNEIAAAASVAAAAAATSSGNLEASTTPEANSNQEPQASQKQVANQQSSAAAQKKAHNTVGGAGASGGGGKKKKRKARGQGAAGTNQSSARDTRDDTPPPEEAIDPDEPTYCLCDQISFGEMILCDNDLCPIEWFHFSCVSLMSKPKGKWFCPNCRGDRPNIMKPKAQFLKELERYNREKEEKT